MKSNMLGMTRDELTQFLEYRLQPVEAIFQKHIPKYFSEWDDLFTTVVWLLRAKKFWHNPDKSKPLIIPYDFVPYKKDRSYTVVRFKEDGSFTSPEIWRGTRPATTHLPPKSEEMIQKLQDYFETVLGNVSSILNIRFVRRKLCKPSSSSRDPQLRLIFWDYSSVWGGYACLPGEKGGGDIGVTLYRNRETNPSLHNFNFVKKNILHELGHALGLSHMHSNNTKDCSCSVRGHKVLSPPPITSAKSGTIYHKYANPADSMMIYSQFSNINLSNFNENAHFGYLDYMALLCVYGPNFNNENIKHIKESYEEGRLLRIEVNVGNYNKIKQIIRGRGISYKKTGSTDKSIFRIVNDKYSGIILRLNNTLRPSVFAGKKEEGKTLIYTDTPIHVDGFAGNTQISRYREDNLDFYGIDLTLSPKTRISALRGSSKDDVIFFNENIKYASGRGGADTYCFYQDKWGKHRIKERAKFGTPNYVVFCQPELDNLYVYRSGNELVIYDSHQPKRREIRLLRYFEAEPLNHNYEILVISQRRLSGADNISCFHKQFVNSINPFKAQRLEKGQAVPLKSLFVTSFLGRLAYRVEQEVDHDIEINHRHRIDAAYKNKYGKVVRWQGVSGDINRNSFFYKRRDREALHIWWSYKNQSYGLYVSGFFAENAPPLHLVDKNDQHLVTFRGMNNYGPGGSINSKKIKPGTTYGIRLLKSR